MRDGNYDDWSDEEDRVKPKFPGIVKVAGFIWIVIGALSLLSSCVSFELQGAGGGGSPLAGGCCPLIIGIAFLFCGFQTVNGTARDTSGNGFGSIGLGLLQVVIGVAMGILGGALPGQNNQIKGDPTIAFVLGGVNALIGFVLILAGVMALSGRTAYRMWRAANKPGRKKPKKRRDERDADSEDDLPPRRPRRSERDEGDDEPRN